jgi:ABC-2 type transport system ATP-binding protein
MNSNALVKTTALCYRFSKNAIALSDINLHIERGSIYGFLGPNGSGKTTTLRLLLGLLKMQQGSVEMFGQSIQLNRIEVLKKVGSLIESPSLYGHLSARENLEIYRPAYGMPKHRVDEVLTLCGLADTGNKQAKNFSLGMKQRLSIALALLPKPELLILDEPTNGLDPGGIIELRELIKKLNKEEGITMLISSHLLVEVERMVSHVGIIFKGKMLFQGSLPELNQFQQRQTKLLLHTSDNEAAIRLLQEHSPERLENAIAVPYNGIAQVAQINRQLLKNDLDVYLLQPQENNLEQLFINLTSTQS